MYINKAKSYWIVSNIKGSQWDDYVEHLKWFYEHFSATHQVLYFCIGDINIFVLNSLSNTVFIHKSEEEAFILDGWMSEETKNKLSKKTYSIKNKNNLTNLIGEFSAVYINKNECYIYTDFYGTIPAYHLSLNETNIVSNDLRAILVYQEYDIKLSDIAIKKSLTPSAIVGENDLPDGITFFHGISKIARNSAYEFYKNKILNLQKESFFNKKIFDMDAVSEFKRIFSQSIDDRMNGKLSGIQFSGGIDSASILGMAIENNHRFINVNMSFKDNELMFSQDQDIVKRTSKDLGLKTYILWGDSTLRFQNCELDNDPLIYVDGPEVRANSLACLGMNSIMYDAGVEQVLTGESGDVILGEQIEFVIFDSLIKNGFFRDAIKLLQDIFTIRNIKMNSFNGIKTACDLVISPLIKPLAERTYIHNNWREEKKSLPAYLLAFEIERGEKLTSSSFKNLSHGHKYMLDFLWPKARYFDALPIDTHYVHPFLDSRMIDFALSVQPYLHMDYKNILSGSYAVSKYLARQSFKNILPEYLIGKKDKTSYEGMAKSIFNNSKKSLLQLFMSSDSEVYRRELVDKTKFQDYFISEFIRLEDVNAQLGIEYQYLSAVISLEIWLRIFGQSKNKIIDRIKPKKYDLKFDVELI